MLARTHLGTHSPEEIHIIFYLWFPGLRDSDWQGHPVISRTSRVELHINEDQCSIPQYGFLARPTVWRHVYLLIFLLVDISVSFKLKGFFLL